MCAGLGREVPDLISPRAGADLEFGERRWIKPAGQTCIEGPIFRDARRLPGAPLAAEFGMVGPIAPLKRAGFTRT